MLTRTVAWAAGLAAALAAAIGPAAPVHAFEVDFRVSGRVSCFDVSKGARSVDWVVTSNLDVEGLLIFGRASRGHFYSPDGDSIGPHGSFKANSFFESAPSDGRVDVTFGIQRMDNPGYTEYYEGSADVTHACDFGGHAKFTPKCDKTLLVDITANGSNPGAGPFKVTWDDGSRTVTLGPGASTRLTLNAAHATEVTVYAGDAHVATGGWHDPGCIYPDDPSPDPESDTDSNAGAGGAHGGSDTGSDGGSLPGTISHHQDGAVGGPSHPPNPSTWPTTTTPNGVTASPASTSAPTPASALPNGHAGGTPLLALVSGLVGSALTLGMAAFLVLRRTRSSSAASSSEPVGEIHDI